MGLVISWLQPPARATALCQEGDLSRQWGVRAEAWSLGCDGCWVLLKEVWIFVFYSDRRDLRVAYPSSVVMASLPQTLSIPSGISPTDKHLTHKGTKSRVAACSGRRRAFSTPQERMAEKWPAQLLGWLSVGPRVNTSLRLGASTAVSDPTPPWV